MSFIRKVRRNGKIYLAEVKTTRIDGKVSQKFIRYIGKEVDGERILSTSISNMNIEEVKIYGPFIVLDQISKELNLKEYLGEYSNEILSLVYAHCVDPKSINKMEDWFKTTDLNFILDLENLTEKRLLNALDSIEKIDFDFIQRKIYEEAKEKYKLKGGGIVYDVTNTYLYGKKCPLAKLGKDKRGVRGSKLIQIGLGVTREEGFPVFHKTFSGNIADARTLTDLISIFSEYKVKSGVIVFDRGVSSEINIKFLKKYGWDSICGLKSTSILKKIILDNIQIENMLNIKNRIKVNNSTFYVITIDHNLGEIKGRLSICFNEKKQRDIRESRYDEISEGRLALKSGEVIKDGLKKYFWQNGSIKHEVIEQEQKMDGFSFIFCTKKLRNDEIVRIYFTDKDIVERAFKSLKGVTQLRPIRHWLYNRVKAHILICYFSYMILSVIKLKLKKMEVSPVKALEELKTLYKVYLKEKNNEFEITRISSLSKFQENILKSIDKKLVKINL